METTKQKILLLHGALGSRKTFDSILDLISDAYQPITFDFRGHGVYSTDKTISADLLCNQVIEFIENQQISGLPVFGYSMGGYIALMACLKKPKIFSKIITLGTKYEWNNEIAANEIKQLQTILNLPQEHPFIKNLIEMHGAENYQNCVNVTAELMKELGLKKYLNDETISKILNETLLLLGALDSMVNIEETSKVFESLPNGKFIVLENSKHQFEKVNQQDLRDRIFDFLM